MTLAELARIAEREHLLIAAASGDGSDVSALPDKLAAIAAATSALRAAGVPHALIGGLAVGIRSGVPRATLDVDFAVASGSDRAALERLLVNAGFHLVRVFPHSIKFKHPSGEPLQLALNPAFDAMIERAEPVPLNRLNVPVVTRADLLTMKRLAAAVSIRRRSKALCDQADIALLEGDVPDEDADGW